MSVIATRAELESRLKGVAARLVARQFARAGFSGLAGAGGGLGLGVLFIGLLPRLLLDASGSTVAIGACALAGFVVGAAWQFRRFKAPTVQDAALALEARLGRDTGSLGAALRTGEDSVFYRPLLVQAGEDLSRAKTAPAPVLIPTARLVVVPLLVLTSAVAFVWVLSGGVPQAPVAGAGTGPSSWAPVDIGGGRSAEDRAAYRQALGMQETAARLNQSVATLRDATATHGEKWRALQEAREALASDGAKSAGVEPVALPDELPEGAEEQAALADKIAAVADGIGDAAKKTGNGKDGTVDTGGDGEFAAGEGTRELVPFPPPPATEVRLRETLAVQTPARRDMAGRAVEALERISNE